jgi:hypothetical protein
MSFQLVDIFSNLSHGLSNIGFFFGAGTSLKAGYPLMPGLTIKVLEKLVPDEFALLDKLVSRSLNRNIDKTIGEPNIEVISDILEAGILTADIKHHDYARMLELRNTIRQRIVDVLVAVKNPRLDDHLRFFNALQRLLSGRPEQVWIFTPNYEVLFEIASSIAKFPLLDGFLGASVRFFSIGSLLHQSGNVQGHNFQPLSQPTIRLIKLHGSLDWWKQNGIVYSTQDPDKFQCTPERVIVLPRKKKMTETLESPFEDLFRVSARVLGTVCKYIVSCGYSYGDQHINETLLLPKLKEAKINLTAFVKKDSANLDPFRNLPAFSFATENSSKKKNCPIENNGSDLWQFEKLVDLLVNAAGI